MGRFALLVVLTVTVGTSFGDERKDLTRVAVPDDRDKALKVIKEWLDQRGIDVEARKGALVMNKGGVLMNITPLVFSKELDRLRVFAFYHPKDEYKGKKEFEERTTKMNKAQNFLQVFTNDDGDLAIGSNLTFYDELTARHFDAFIDLYVETLKRYVLTEETVKMLK